MSDSLKHTLRGYELDPVSMRSSMGAGWALTANGEPQRALEYFERAWVSSKVEPVWRGKFISLVEQDRYDQAEAWLGEHLDPANIEADVAFLRGHQDPSKALVAADTIVKETLEGRLRSLFGGVMVASLGQEDAYYRLLSNDSSVSIRGLWWLSSPSIRQDPRLQEIVGNLSLIPYWEEFGPPDACNLLPSRQLRCFR